jgi:DNA-binding transcriptional ArsR family regulator
MQKLPAEWRDVSELFVALGDEQRQRILLTFEPGERLNVTQIVSNSALSRTAVSHHLKILRQAGALQSEKIGKEVYFWIAKDHIVQLLKRVMDYVQEQT